MLVVDDPYMAPRESAPPRGLTTAQLERVRMLQRGSLLATYRELGSGMVEASLSAPAPAPSLLVRSTKKRHWRRRPRYRW